VVIANELAKHIGRFEALALDVEENSALIVEAGLTLSIGTSNQMW